MAERLRLAVERRAWPHGPVTASFGVATMTARTRQSKILVEQADFALYHSKNHGRNQVSHMTDLDKRPEAGASRILVPKCSRPDLADPAVEDPWNDPRLSPPLDHAGGRLAEAYDNIVDGLSKALNLHDSETSEHSRRVTSLTMKMARSLDFGVEELCHIRRGALLHDIGKMGVPDMILHKPGPLSDVEWTEMRKHPSHALKMLEPIEFLRPAMEIPYAHHERWDGTGYPRGLKGEQIPLAARAFAVVDVYDALTHDRPYRAAWPGDEALAHIDDLAGVHFDPEMVVALHRALGPNDAPRPLQ
jgi:putative nucleotidyltransferase with HDIG domain